MEEYNFTFTQDEANRIIQAINESNSRLIGKMQYQFEQQIEAKQKQEQEKEIKETKNEKANNKNS